MANFRVTAALRNARLDGLKTAIDAGSGPGTIKIYGGTQPANADTALSGQTLAGTLTFADPSAPAASAGLLTFNAITQDTAADNSVNPVTWARIADSTGATVFDCDVGTSGATLNMITTNITAGGPIQITSFTISDPAGYKVALPTYVASGTASFGASSPLTPTYPAGLAAADRLLLQVFVRATDGAVTAPAGWTLEFIDPLGSLGFQWVFSATAAGSESGSLNVTWSGTTPTVLAIAQIHAFRGVTAAVYWYEPGDVIATTSVNVAMPVTVATGTDRLAVALTASASGTVTIAASTGETGGDWVEALAEVSSGAAAGGLLQLQTADMAAAGILSGGTSTLSGATSTAVRSLLLISATGTAAVVGAAIHQVSAGTGAGTATITTTDLTLVAGDVALAHVVAKADASAVASFANVPTDSAGGTWTLVIEGIQGTGPSVRAAVFKRTATSAPIRLSSVSFIASSTPDSIALNVNTVSRGDVDNLKVKFNSAAGVSHTVTLDTAPAADSTVVGFYGARTSSALGAVPSGFTNILSSSVSTHLRWAVYYDAVSPGQSATFTGAAGATNTTGILVEVPLLAAGLAAVTGASAGILNPLQGAAVGVHGVVGTAAGILNPLVGAAVGTHFGVVTGTAAAIRNRLLGDAVGSHAGVVTGTGAAMLNRLLGTAVGTHFVFAEPGIPQGPLPVAPAISPDETATPPVQLPLVPTPPLAPPPVFAATTADHTPLPSHAHYGSDVAAVDARGAGAPGQARWWAEMDEEEIYRSGVKPKPRLPQGPVTVIVAATEADARGPGAAAARWWAGMDEDAIFRNGQRG